ncbi:MAG TPA: hypothetical protein VKA53_01875, partial [Thermoanaerobaculia bacterium]|nr:hypothetical protein [Thermoanaerobaculia bacterium]
ALPFDAEKAIAMGPAVAVIDDVETSQSTAYADYAVARDGTLAFATEALASPPNRLVWIDRHGRRTNVLDEAHRFLTVSLSHGGHQAATTILGDNRDLWTVSFDRGVLSRLTTGGKAEFDPVWTADDKQLIYTVDVPPYTPYRISVGAPDSGQPLWKDKVAQDTVEPRLSPDGRAVAFVRSNSETGLDIYLRPLDGSGPPRPFRATKASEGYPTFSPDGRWLAYESDESGRYEIYAERVDGSGGRVQVSANGGREPLWAADGEIFFRHDDEIRVVATHAGEKLELQPVRTLFVVPTAFSPNEEMRDYDVTRDGSRVIAIYTPEESRPRQIEVITNWMQQLPRLAPASGK